MKKLEPKEQVIFNISGGTGKHIMATAVVEALRKQMPKAKIIVTCPWTDVFKNNPHVDHVSNIATDHGFYRNHVLGKDTHYLANDPYLSEDFVYKRGNLIKIWCDMFGIEYNGELPKMYFSDEEKERIKEKLPQDKPLFFIQTSGGAQNQEFPISWMRDMPLPLAQKVTDHMNAKGYRTVHLRREDQYPIENTTWIPMNIREMLGSVQFAEKALFIDSVAQHAAAAQNTKAVVTWIGNKPDVFGYEMHENILPTVPQEFRHHMDSYLDLWNIAGKLEECPYDTNDIFDFDEIVERLEKD